MKKRRIDQFNLWPQTLVSDAEEKFKVRLGDIELSELFFPYELPDTNDKHLHVCVSYMLDALDSLPLRPDHAFDWIWRSFEYLTSHAIGGQGNITNELRNTVCPTVDGFFSLEEDVSDAFFELTEKIPFQTCEYLLKRICESGPYSFTGAQQNSLSSYAKRLLFSTGNPPVISTSLQTVLEFLSQNYDYANMQDRRNGASLIRRIIRLEKVSLNSSFVQLTKSEVLFFLVSGLGYAFRNDRAHAKSIAPFRSSTASITTYAHCWFMFLLFYEITFILLHTPNSPIILNGPIAINFRKNNTAYFRLFGDYING
ncbi:hypothetical protein [Pseudomonas fluorescens]|uniref:hypothetical protein n=1 Tax=Pseudomonas fluorescens TaxID=294 RepID=UPI001655ECA2|nr:hypothetical protein [Pseudomonas fluorescens]MBC8786286.1 hypothetical protein [Pseudomonas fluorescens]